MTKDKESKKIYLIRHAESEANVGAVVFAHDNIVKITSAGKKQAEELSEILLKDYSQPDRIIVSKFIRTIETAEPTIKKFTDAEVHLWLDTHEFEWITSPDDVHPDREVMREKTLQFFTNSDPYVKKQGTSESFKEFTDRIYNVILKFKKLQDGVNLIFTHAFVIKMLLLLLEKNIDPSKPDFDYKTLMQEYGQHNVVFKVPNTKILDVTELVENYGK